MNLLKKLIDKIRQHLTLSVTTPPERASTMDLRDRVIAVLCDYVDECKSFTLLNVTEAVKADGGDFVRHRDVRPLARKIMDDGLIEGSEDYAITQIEVELESGDVGYANLYHDVNVDPEDYDGRAVVASPPCTSNNPSPIFTMPKAPVKPQPPTGGAHLSKVMTPRGDGAVEIPLSIIAEAFDGDVTPFVHITNHPNSITINLAKKWSNHTKGDRILRAGSRLGAKVLTESNIYARALKFEAYTDKIVVSEA